MKRALLLSIAAIGAFGVCAQALASATVTGTTTLTVQQAAGVNLTTPLTLPSVSTTAVVSSPVSTSVPISSGTGSTATTTTVSDASGPPVASNATLTIYGQAGDAVSVAAPESFQVIRAGGTETLTVKTNTNTEFGVGDNGVVVGGPTADTMSVNVGGSIALASADPLVPGPYEGMLVVVVQYN